MQSMSAPTLQLTPMTTLPPTSGSGRVSVMDKGTLSQMSQVNSCVAVSLGVKIYVPNMYPYFNRKELLIIAGQYFVNAEAVPGILSWCSSDKTA